MTVLGAPRFAGQCAVITGGARGIGLGIAQRLAAEGCAIVIWDREPQAFDAARAGFDAAAVIGVDVASETSVRDAAARTLERVGVDILVNNAGISGPVMPSWDYPVEAWDRVLAVDLTGVFLCCRALLPHMRSRDYGRIVNIASIAGKEGSSGIAAYSAAKAGVIGFSKALARELIGSDVLVNCIAPVMAETELLDQMTPEHIAATKARIPMGRFVGVPEIAATAAFAASRDCSFTTGFTFDVSGGRATY
jgi:NAD(P)-dependent dehydrogenase (short-subunit alcohol dehydrogenase family)